MKPAAALCIFFGWVYITSAYTKGSSIDANIDSEANANQYFISRNGDNGNGDSDGNDTGGKDASSDNDKHSETQNKASNIKNATPSQNPSPSTPNNNVNKPTMANNTVLPSRRNLSPPHSAPQQNPSPPTPNNNVNKQTLASNTVLLSPRNLPPPHSAPPKNPSPSNPNNNVNKQIMASNTVLLSPRNLPPPHSAPPQNPSPTTPNNKVNKQIMASNTVLPSPRTLSPPQSVPPQNPSPNNYVNKQIMASNTVLLSPRNLSPPHSATPQNPSPLTPNNKVNKQTLASNTVLLSPRNLSPPHSAPPQNPSPLTPNKKVNQQIMASNTVLTSPQNLSPPHSAPPQNPSPSSPDNNVNKHSMASNIQLHKPKPCAPNDTVCRKNKANVGTRLLPPKKKNFPNSALSQNLSPSSPNNNVNKYCMACSTNLNKSKPCVANDTVCRKTKANAGARLLPPKKKNFPNSALLQNPSPSSPNNNVNKHSMASNIQLHKPKPCAPNDTVCRKNKANVGTRLLPPKKKNFPNSALSQNPSPSSPNNNVNKHSMASNTQLHKPKPCAPNDTVCRKAKAKANAGVRLLPSKKNHFPNSGSSQNRYPYSPHNNVSKHSMASNIKLRKPKPCAPNDKACRKAKANAGARLLHPKKKHFPNSAPSQDPHPSSPNNNVNKHSMASKTKLHKPKPCAPNDKACRKTKGNAGARLLPPKKKHFPNSGSSQNRYPSSPNNNVNKHSMTSNTKLHKPKPCAPNDKACRKTKGNAGARLFPPKKKHFPKSAPSRNRYPSSSNNNVNKHSMAKNTKLHKPKLHKPKSCAPNDKACRKTKANAGARLFPPKKKNFPNSTPSRNSYPSFPNKNVSKHNMASNTKVHKPKPCAPNDKVCRKTKANAGARLLPPKKKHFPNLAPSRRPYPSSPNKNVNKHSMTSNTKVHKPKPCAPNDKVCRKTKANSGTRLFPPKKKHFSYLAPSRNSYPSFPNKNVNKNSMANNTKLHKPKPCAPNDKVCQKTKAKVGARLSFPKNKHFSYLAPSQIPSPSSSKNSVNKQTMASNTILPSPRNLSPPHSAPPQNPSPSTPNNNVHKQTMASNTILPSPRNLSPPQSAPPQNPSPSTPNNNVTKQTVVSNDVLLSPQNLPPSHLTIPQNPSPSPSNNSVSKPTVPSNTKLNNPKPCAPNDKDCRKTKAKKKHFPKDKSSDDDYRSWWWWFYTNLI